jgi:DNA-binding SARP family transcriptional activator
MVAYLALHRHEPVTGERLRTRVLVHADVEASTRTLANTASAVRRSLGIDAHGPRLHPVTSSGLYATHGISSDVEVFSTLVARARQLPVADAASLAREALLLIQGEPLASTLRGFEWFLAEGHAARLARDGEWAALALHHDSLQRGNYELAFWSLQQGLLIDPYSDALAEALSRVPRLREFGGNGTRLAQHQPVGTGGTVAMSWSLSGLSQQVFQ